MKKLRDPSGPSEVQKPAEQPRQVKHCRRFIGGPDRDRTDDLFHAMEARSQLRHRPTFGCIFIVVELDGFVNYGA